MDNKLVTLLKQGPAISPSKKTYTLLMRTLIVVLVASVVALVLLEPMLTK